MSALGGRWISTQGHMAEISCSYVFIVSIDVSAVLYKKASLCFIGGSKLSIRLYLDGWGDVVNNGVKW